MFFTQILLLLLAATLYLAMAIHAWQHRTIPGGAALCWLLVSTLLWALGSLGELLTTTIDGMVLWRNIQQISSAAMPLMVFWFVTSFAGYQQLQRTIRYIWPLPVIGLFLIFTNPWHGLSRSSVYVEPSAVFGDTLIVELTAFGTVLVATNFLIALIAIGVLAYFSTKVASMQRPKVFLILCSFLLVFLANWLKVSILTDLGIHISLGVLYLPGTLLLWHGVLRSGLVELQPIARDTVFHVVQQGILVLNQAGTIIDANEYAAHFLKSRKLFGKQLIGLTEKQIRNHQTLSRLVGLDAENQLRVETFPAFDGFIHIEVQAYSLKRHAEAEEALGSMFIFRDATIQYQQTQELHYMANTDELTGLPNRRSFFATAEKEVAQANASSLPLTILMVDIDRFKSVNDAHGHAAGDALLRSFAQLATEELPSDAIIGRIGGEEFAVLLPNTGLLQGKDVAERLRVSVANSNLDQIPYTISIGAACHDGLTEKDFPTLSKEADVALYNAKAAGRNQVVVVGLN